MRAGAIPMLAWGTILLVLYAIHAIWDGRTVPTITTAFALLVIYGFGVALWLVRRDALKRGPPPPERVPEAEPSASLAAVLVGLSLATILFGTVWAGFLVWFGAVMLIASLGRAALELRAERASRERVLSEGAEQ